MKISARIAVVAALLALRTSAYGQFHDTCDTHSLLAINQEAEGKFSLLCQGVADVALGKSEQGHKILLRVIKQAPKSDAAFEAHERLLGLYARSGKVREAALELGALLAIRPNEQDLLDEKSFFETVGRSPDMTVSHWRPVTIPRSATDGSLNIPFTSNGHSATFYLDTGANFSLISDAEAHALGLTITPVTSKVQDSSGLLVSMQVAIIDEIRIGPIRVRHVPFLVLPATNPPFNEIPLDHQGLLGIQVALALQTIRLSSDGHLDLAFAGNARPDAPTLTFDDMFPALHVSYRGKVIPFTFDTGAEYSDLSPAFARDFPEVIKLGVEKRSQIMGVGGPVQARTIELPEWSLELNGKTAVMHKMSVLLEKTTGSSGWAAGNLGIDILQQVEPFTIDFRNMQLTVEP